MPGQESMGSLLLPQGEINGPGEQLLCKACIENQLGRELEGPRVPPPLPMGEMEEEEEEEEAEECTFVFLGRAAASILMRIPIKRKWAPCQGM